MFSITTYRILGSLYLLAAALFSIILWGFGQSIGILLIGLPLMISAILFLLISQDKINKLTNQAVWAGMAALILAALSQGLSFLITDAEISLDIIAATSMIIVTATIVSILLMIFGYLHKSMNNSKINKKANAGYFNIER